MAYEPPDGWLEDPHPSWGRRAKSVFHELLACAKVKSPDTLQPMNLAAAHRSRPGGVRECRCAKTATPAGSAHQQIRLSPVSIGNPGSGRRR